jgi:hypothetical protein
MIGSSGATAMTSSSSRALAQQTPGHGVDRARLPVLAPASLPPRAAGVAKSTPYTLRHSFASLLLYEGRSVIYVARQLGHDARLTLTRYGHVIDEFRGAAARSRRDGDPRCPCSPCSLSVPQEP